MAAARIDEGARDEAPAIEGLAVAREGELVLGAALEVLPREAGDVAARDAPQFLDVQGAPKVATGVVASTRGGGLS
jgi:hypothetical protein